MARLIQLSIAKVLVELSIPSPSQVFLLQSMAFHLGFGGPVAEWVAEGETYKGIRFVKAERLADVVVVSP